MDDEEGDDKIMPIRPDLQGPIVSTTLLLACFACMYIMSN